ncbi:MULTISPECIES: hypothetical protein [unclassified Pseudomonas]|uniref:hypothetical protein n=1 Tax=unclassified Pseudomonas TaxID=196821 RepID=UPI002447EACA|nr:MULTISPECIES: hypothetical protein [unclassified Pseudomonas]MDG9926307.1 hypothetical protein [Pseudomonas sp. GD04045]MDH0034197.1 hypothetical protein [Pseudomonas sp. GD04019]
MSQVKSVLMVIAKLIYRGVMLWFCLLLLLYMTYKMFERSHAIDVLPAQLEVDGLVLVGGESGIREGCGVAVLHMSPRLRARLQREGMAVLQDARQARGHADDDYYHYAPWQALPTPDEGGGLSPIFLGLQCADADDELSTRIGRASRGFYTTKHEGALLVLPQEGLIVFGYFG